MNREFLPFLLALLLSLVWVYLSTRLLLRSPGGGISWNPIKLRGRKLAGAQNYFGLGVLGFGGGMFIFDMTNRYVRWKLYGNPSDSMQFQSVIQLLFSSLLAGVLFGLITGFTDSIFDRK